MSDDTKGTIEETPWGHYIVTEDGMRLPVVKKRLEWVVDDDFSMDTGSLLGSAFHVLEGDVIIWQGVVVGEPGPDRFLCEIEKIAPGQEKVQRIFPLDVLMGSPPDGRRHIENALSETKVDVLSPHLEWRFYDSVAQAREAFQVWAIQQAADGERQEVEE